MTDTATTGYELTVTKRLSAAPDEVFAAWTDADNLKQWITPGGGSADVPLLEAKVGGRFRIDMHTPEGTYEHNGEYLEVEPGKRLVFTWASPATGGKDSIVTIDLAPDGDGTNLTLTHVKLPAPEVAERHKMGWGSILEQLAGALGS